MVAVSWISFTRLACWCFLASFSPFGKFVTVLAVIDQPTDRGDRVGRDLDQVDLVGSSEVDGLAEWEHAQLLAVDADHTDFTGANFPVDPNERAGRWRTEIGALQDTPNG
jgi:hypothetical protein